MSLILHHGWLSSASRRVRLCLAEKGLDYEHVVVDLSRQEHHRPEYLAINPNGVVPALMHDGRPIHESSVICEYLDDCFPDPPLRPDDAFDRATMRNFVRYTDEKSLPNLLILNWSIALQPTASGWSDAELAQRLAAIPTPERREAWLRIARRPYTEDEKATALRGLLALLDRMDAMLADADWLVGDRFSLADIAATPFVTRIAELSRDTLDDARHARTRDWWDRVRTRPSFASARLETFASALAERAA